jgi:hypothetical protein
MSADLQRYLDRLALELKKRGLASGLASRRILDEAREHLVDAAAQGQRQGMTPGAALDDAIARFGAPEVVAANFAIERFRVLNRMLLVCAVAAGLAIAWVDSRPTWDDAGVTAFSMVIAAAILALISPGRPWLWALGVGIWIPLHTLVRTASPGAVAMFVLLIFPFAGAYAGMAARRMLATAGPRVRFGGIHDRKRTGSHLHWLSRAKGGHVLSEMSEEETRAAIIPMLERAALESTELGASGRVELNLLEDSLSAGTRVRRYRAVFANGTTLSVVHKADPSGSSLDATRE